MKTIVGIDPSVAEVADMLPGHSAERMFVGGEWKITKDAWAGDEQ